MEIKKIEKGKLLEALLYPMLLLSIMWTVFLLDRNFDLNLYKFGVKPNTVEGIKGIIFMPFIHGQKDFSHIINNTVPVFIFLSTLIYFYREIAVNVILFLWLGGGFLLWYLASDTNTYHIGMSGIIYGLFGFLFLSGMIRKFLPLQAISLLVAFIYGSMIWGVLPTEERISWEGHLSGLLIGFLLAFAFRKKGPTAPKFKYEIEQEMGIEPPDFEKEWQEKKEQSEAKQQKIKDETQKLKNSGNVNSKKEMKKTDPIVEKNMPMTFFSGENVKYDYIPKNKEKSNHEK